MKNPRLKQNWNGTNFILEIIFAIYYSEKNSFCLWKS